MNWKKQIPKILFILVLISTSCAKPKEIRQKIKNGLGMYFTRNTNANVYRTNIDIEAVRLTDKYGNYVFMDTVTIKVLKQEKGYKPRHVDYKIINEDLNGYSIIRVLPRVKLDTIIELKTKRVNVQKFTLRDSIPYIIVDSVKVSDTTITISLVETMAKYSKFNGYNYYFAVKNDDFTPMSKTLLMHKVVGMPLVHPFKLRPAKGNEGWNLDGEFSVSYNLALKFRIAKKQNPFKENYVSIIPYGFGIGSAKYFRENTDGTSTEKEDAFAITYYQAAIIFSVKKVNFGVSMGLDGMLDKRNDWHYQGKPWFSFGLGYKFKTD